MKGGTQGRKDKTIQETKGGERNEDQGNITLKGKNWTKGGPWIIEAPGLTLKRKGVTGTGRGKKREGKVGGRKGRKGK